MSQPVVVPDVADEMQDLMRSVVCRGTATRAQHGIDNFSVAGKTGTGLKAQPNGTYRDEEGELVYYASFVGFFPAEDPQVTVLVSIDEPPAGDINRFGGTAAAPVFARLAPTISSSPRANSACPNWLAPVQSRAVTSSIMIQPSSKGSPGVPLSSRWNTRTRSAI